MGVYGVYGVLCICSEVVSMPQHTLSQIILHGPKVLAIVRVGGKSLSFHVRLDNLPIYQPLRFCMPLMNTFKFNCQTNIALMDTV